MTNALAYCIKVQITPKKFYRIDHSRKFGKHTEETKESLIEATDYKGSYTWLKVAAKMPA